VSHVIRITRRAGEFARGSEHPAAHTSTIESAHPMRSASTDMVGDDREL
jgi:hypothetical protein